MTNQPYDEPNVTLGGDALRSGDLMFGPIGGVVPGFLPVGVGQLALFLTRKWWRLVRSPKNWFQVRHVAVVQANAMETYLVQAMPRGAEYVPLERAKHWTNKHVYFRPHYAGVTPPVWPSDVADAAIDYVGVPYGFLTYVRLAAGALRMPLTEAWLRKALSSRRDMICSQLADQALADAGYHVFDDGRLPQDVVPAELFDALISRPGWFLIPGHPVVGQWTHTSRSSAVFARK